jgi:hypothetical protein
MSSRYIDLKFAALEENVAISARLVGSTTVWQRWKMVLTHGPYRRPAITALGIGIFQQLCGFNTLSERNNLSFLKCACADDYPNTQCTILLLFLPWPDSTTQPLPV